MTVPANQMISAITDRMPLLLDGDDDIALWLGEWRAPIEDVMVLTREAELKGLRQGMSLADARAICPELATRPADLAAQKLALEVLRRWASRYSPMIATEGVDGLVADISGVAHLFGGEVDLRADLDARLARADLSARSVIAGTHGAAHALVRHGGGIVPDGKLAEGIGHLPVSALRIDHATADGLARVGLPRISDLIDLPRAPLSRRFGPGLVLRLDQALGIQAESISAEPEPPHFGVRITLPEPIGRQSDVMAGLTRLLDRLCCKLALHHMGARRVLLEPRRVDRATAKVEIGLARPMRDSQRIAALFAKGEVSPPFDPSGNTALVGATIMFEILCNLAV